MRGDGKTSLRGGYGMAYERNFGNVTFNVLFNPPNYGVIALTANRLNSAGGLVTRVVHNLGVSIANYAPLSGTGASNTIHPEYLNPLLIHTLHSFTHS